MRPRVAQAVAVAVLTCCLVACPIGAATAEPILAPDDAAGLANALADAAEEQNICYGWQVTVNDHWDGRYNGVDAGSNVGVGITVTGLPACSRWVQFVAFITYTAESSEAEDDASFEVASNFTTIDAGKLADFGVNEAALLGDDDDLAIYNATAALPLLVADAGLAPAMDVEPATATAPPSGDHVTGQPGSDYIRAFGPIVATVAVLLLAGGGLTAYLLLVEIPRRRRRAPVRSPAPSDQPEQPASPPS
jgi:hypothetical protein